MESFMSAAFRLSVRIGPEPMPDRRDDLIWQQIMGIIDSGPWINGCSGWNGRKFHEANVRRLLSKMVPSGVPVAGGHVRYAHTEANEQHKMSSFNEVVYYSLIFCRQAGQGTMKLQYKVLVHDNGRCASDVAAKDDRRMPRVTSRCAGYGTFETTRAWSRNGAKAARGLQAGPGGATSKGPRNILLAHVPRGESQQILNCRRCRQSRPSARRARRSETAVFHSSARSNPGGRLWSSARC
ncbi:hypothetical protein L1887_58890 [Cichorium endivia]|nr:hypothetical protein L1887_58890 [Cichorium endivia]